MSDQPRSDYRDWDYQNELDRQEEEAKKKAKSKPKTAKLEGLDSAIIALHRRGKIPVHRRAYLNQEGMGLSEQLTIITLQVMLSPELVTKEELDYLAFIKREPADE